MITKLKASPFSFQIGSDFNHRLNH